MERSKSMTAQTKGRIRHVALSVKDPWETAEFYKQALGLEEVVELDGPLAEGVFLTDGVVNLAILHFKSDEASQGTGVDYVGIHHIGFWVDDVVEQGKIARNAGATWIMGDTNNPHGYEVKHTDLNGIIFDIAAHGWVGSQMNPGSEDNVVRPNPQRRLAKFDERRKPLMKELRENARTVHRAAEGDKDAVGQVDQAVQRVFDGREKMHAIDREMYQTLAKDLSPARRARLAVFFAQYHQRMGRMMMEHRAGMTGQGCMGQGCGERQGGPGPGPGMHGPGGKGGPAGGPGGQMGMNGPGPDGDDDLFGEQ